jgi:hypothetical protein
MRRASLVTHQDFIGAQVRSESQHPPHSQLRADHTKLRFAQALK